MKKLLAALLVLAMMLMGVAALAEGDGYELALVTDVGNIDDQSFNQSSYEGMVAFAEENGLKGLANIILVGKLFKEVGFCSEETLDKALQKCIPARKAAMLDFNRKAIEIGRAQ